MDLYWLYCSHISPRSVRTAIRRSALTIFPAGHSNGCSYQRFFMKLLHGLDAVCLQNLNRQRFPQSPDFAGAGVGPRSAAAGPPTSQSCCFAAGPGFPPSAFDQLIKTGNAGFDFFQQLVVGGDLPVYFPLSVRMPRFSHLAGRWPQVDRGFYQCPAACSCGGQCGRLTGSLQCPIGV